MESHEVAAELNKPLAGQLLRAAPLLRIAYVSSDGTPRVVPVAFLWAAPHILVFTLPTSAKAKALARRPAVAITIDYDGLPPRALLIRGTARVESVDGVPRQYIDASLKTQSGRGSEDFAAGVEAMYDSMVKITIQPTWARLNDFETSLPRDVEQVIAAREGAGDQQGVGRGR